MIEKELLGALERVLPGRAAAIRFREIRRYPHAVPHFDVGRYRQLARLRALQAEQRAARATPLLRRRPLARADAGGRGRLGPARRARARAGLRIA